MPPIDPEIQRLISRFLDGELPEGQQAALYRHLLKNPQARQTMEDYQANDRLAGEALAGLWPAGQPPVASMALSEADRHPAAHRPFSISRLLVGVAAAAAIGLLAGSFWLTTLSSPPKSPILSPMHLAVAPADVAAPVNRPPAVMSVDLDAAAETATGPLATGGDDVGFVGLVDERENRIYLLKVEQAPRSATGQFGDF